MMNKRYQKVMALYGVSTLIPALLIKSTNSPLKWSARTAAGYSIFAAGLKAMTKAKQKKQ